MRAERTGYRSPPTRKPEPAPLPLAVGQFVLVHLREGALRTGEVETVEGKVVYAEHKGVILHCPSRPDADLFLPWVNMNAVEIHLKQPKPALDEKLQSTLDLIDNMDTEDPRGVLRQSLLDLHAASKPTVRSYLDQLANQGVIELDSDERGRVLIRRVRA